MSTSAPVPVPATEGLPAEPHPLRSVHSSNFAEILAHIGASLFVTTYQAGRLVILRNDGGVLNTHFRLFPKPMGMAIAPNKLAVGTAMEIREYHNVPAISQRLDPPGKHDVCFLPRTSHATGDVQIHEMAWIDDEVWFVNTRFSCLCTRSHNYSFQPRWRPPFITELTPDDRCHLNGLCAVDGRPKYVTALGETDDAGGWRRNKPSGGHHHGYRVESDCRTRIGDAPLAAVVPGSTVGAAFGHRRLRIHQFANGRL